MPEASWSRMYCNDALVNFYLNVLMADKIKEARHSMFGETSEMKSLYNV